MHVLDQPEFVNAAAWIQTSLQATELLNVLKAVEASAGRQLNAQRWGPRPLDIDIIFFDNDSIETDVLNIPHPRWKDRPFVCRPVLDLLHPQDERLAKVWRHCAWPWTISPD